MSVIEVQSAPGATIMDRLKQETWPLHQRAERSELQQLLVSGRLPRERYGAWLGQMRLVHGALERALESHAAGHGAIRRVYQTWQSKVAPLDADLDFLGVARPIEPVSSVRGLAGRIASCAAARPIALLGMQYVLEGSMNGGKFIAKAVARAYQLNDGNGLRYLDPYGEAQRERWAEFKGLMNAENFAPGESDAIVEEACAMFEAMPGLGDEVMASA